MKVQSLQAFDELMHYYGTLLCDRYLSSMKPILSDDDYMNLTTAVLAFKEKEGPVLHKYLCQR